jgi:hypothetical protein
MNSKSGNNNNNRQMNLPSWLALSGGQPFYLQENDNFMLEFMIFDCDY